MSARKPLGSVGPTTTASLESVPPPRLPDYPKSSLIVFAIFIAFVLARYVQAGERLSILRTIRIEFLLGGVSIFLAILQMSGRKPNIGRSRILMYSIILLFFCMILALPLAADPVVARTVFNNRAFKFAMLTFLVVVFAESPGYLKIFLASFLFAIFYVTLESVQGLITGSLYWQNQGVMRLHGSVPMYGHPNSLGGVSLGSLPFVIYLWSETRRWYLRAGLLAVATTSTICVIYSGSRTAYVGLIGLLFWMFMMSKNKGRFVVSALVIGTLVVMVLPKQYIERFESIGGQEKEGHSKQTRMTILEDAWTIFMENPLGVGVASFPAKRMERFGRSQDTHNLYLEVATNLGIQGFIVFCVMIGSLMTVLFKTKAAFEAQRRKLRNLAKRATSKGLKRRLLEHDRDLRFMIAVSNATGGFVFIRLVLGLFGMDLYEIYWWFASGVAMSLAGLEIATLRRTRILDRFAEAEAELGVANV